MPTARGVARIYRKHGLGGVTRITFNRLFRGRADVPYQRKVAAAAPERYEMIGDALPAGTSSLLDVGSNLGDVTAHFASRGVWSIGIEKSASLVAEARKRHGAQSDCAFVLSDIQPGDLAKLASFDAVLLLSVHHHWVKEHGPDVAGTMLRDIAAKTNRVLIFEGASRRERYRPHEPDFIDNDEASVTNYLQTYLETHAGDLFSRIVPLGKTKNVGEREPFRWTFALYR
jgi:SAM-dependent methyltransferase